MAKSALLASILFAAAAVLPAGTSSPAANNWTVETAVATLPR